MDSARHTLLGCRKQWQNTHIHTYTRTNTYTHTVKKLVWWILSLPLKAVVGDRELPWWQSASSARLHELLQLHQVVSSFYSIFYSSFTTSWTRLSLFHFPFLSSELFCVDFAFLTTFRSGSDRQDHSLFPPCFRWVIMCASGGHKTHLKNQLSRGWIINNLWEIMLLYVVVFYVIIKFCLWIYFHEIEFYSFFRGFFICLFTFRQRGSCCAATVSHHSRYWKDVSLSEMSEKQKADINI